MNGRVEGIDRLRGLVMVLMALDHVRDFVAPSAAPETMAEPGLPLFLTRWVTHFCAPVFVFLAGTSAYLHGRKRTPAALSSFLLTRGLWLIVLELTVVAFAWTFLPPLRFAILQVIFAIGAAMVAGAVLVRLPPPFVALLSVAAIALHHLLETLPIEEAVRTARVLPLASGEALYALLHVPFVTLQGPFGTAAYLVYPLLPWVFVFSLGWAFGPLVAWPPDRRARLCLRLGTLLVALFVVLRAFVAYGDPRPFTPGEDWTTTLISFLNATKYPPSLQFLLMTLGPALIVLGVAERWTGPLGRALAVFGRVPLFFYVLHLAVANLVGAAWLAWTQGLDRWVAGIFQPPPPPPVELVPVFVAWAVIVLALFPLCRWYAGVKRRGRGWWWSYL